MTCPTCDEDCSISDPCECDCHETEERSAVVFENQSIEYEADVHMLDSNLIHKTRIVVTGRTIAEAHEQFEKVYTRVK
jgi:hypothetical protein